MDILEGMYGTSRSSYLSLPGDKGTGKGARMIVRHSQKVDENKIGSRSRFIESILIENSDGERILFPTTNLVPARAMTQHINMGGSFNDSVAQQILGMAKDFANLGTCSNFIVTNFSVLPEGAGSLREQCRTKMREMKKTFERMYRSDNGYAVEAKKMEDASHTLNENKNTEKLDEYRNLLTVEGSNILSDSIIESVCKYCSNSMTEEEKHMNEAKTEIPTVSVLGRKVSETAWNNLKANKLELLGKPNVSDSSGDGWLTTKVTNKTDELLLKLGAIVPLVKDDSMMNLLSFIVDRLPEERDPVVAKKMRIVALCATKAAGMSMNEGLSGKNKTIREFDNWLSNFSTRGSLMEDYFNPNPYEADDTEHETALDQASTEFKVSHFLESEFGKDLLNYHEKEDKEDPITKTEIKSSLEAYLTSWIETHTDQYIENTSSVADEKIGEVIAHLARDGYIVSGNENFESDTDMSDEMTENDNMGEELTREDILLPNKNQGKDLAQEVTPRTVKDPMTGKEEQPDSSYINRLRTLSGITAPNRMY